MLVFPSLFFPSADPTSATLQSLATETPAFQRAIEKQERVRLPMAIVFKSGAGLLTLIALLLLERSARVHE